MWQNRGVMSEAQNQFSLTHAALSACAARKNHFPVSVIHFWVFAAAFTNERSHL